MDSQFLDSTPDQLARKRRHHDYYSEYELGVLRGWKTFAVFATDNSDGYLGQRPVNDLARATDVIRALGLTNCEPYASCELSRAIYPRSNGLCVGGYPHGVAITHCNLPYEFFGADVHRQFGAGNSSVPGFKERFLALYPRGQVLAIVVHSALNRWGYCLYSEGHLVRCLAGSAQTGIITDVGQHLPEEAAILNGRSVSSIDESGCGEELVFEVTSRFFGNRLDDLHAIDLELTEFRPTTSAKPRLIRTLLGMA